MSERIERIIDRAGYQRIALLVRISWSPVLSIRAACVVVLLAMAGPLWAQGYRLTPSSRNPDQVVVDRLRHWEAWTMPSHLVEIERDGTVSARNFRGVYELLSDKTFGRPVTLTSAESRISNIDSTLKRDLDGNSIRDPNTEKLIYEHVVRPGVSRAGSNSHLAQNIVDGSDSTYWEPNFQDPLEDWWIEVDLGRPVPLQRLLLHFVPEKKGDPFYRYILIFGPGQRNHGPDPSDRDSEIFIPFEGVNTDQRTFVFDAELLHPDLPPDPRASSKLLSSGDAYKANSDWSGVSTPSPEWNGKLVETIRIVVTDTRAGRAEEISEQQWNDLPPSERGDVVYFLKDGDFQEPVDKETYFNLAETRRGEAIHYRRELPRLGDVEAWGQGDDIGPGILDGGVLTQTTTTGDPAAMFDGVYQNYNKFENYVQARPDRNIITVDIGGTVWLNEVRMVTQVPPRGYLMRSSAGATDAQGNLQWERLSSVEREANDENGLFRLLTDVLEPTRRVRFLDLVTFATGKYTDGTRLPRIRVMWLFSNGPPAEVVLESDLISLPGLFSLGAVRWDIEEPPGSSVEIRTRTGDQLLERIRYCDLIGNCDYTKAKHKRLSFTTKGPIDTSQVVGPGWSPWSRKYQHSGDLATSPGLRRFMQIQVRLINHDRTAVPAIKRISVDLRKPLAQQLAAEVWPAQATAGRLDTFEVFVQPSFLVQPFDSSSPGFDEVILRASPAIDLDLVDVALGTEEELSGDQPVRLFDRRAVDSAGDAVLLDAGGDTLRIMSRRDSPASRLDSIWLRLPEPLVSEPAALLPRTYFRLLEPGDEVPSGLDGKLLTSHSYDRLPIDTKGAVRYFQKDGDAVSEVDDAVYQGLPEEEQGPVRYFRIVTGLGEQTVFTSLGDSLDGNAHNRLVNAKGWVVGQGRLLRLRFASTIYLPSTELKLAVRNTAENAPWQPAVGQDVTSLSPAISLDVQAEQIDNTIDDVTIAPNPFTPNMDAVNDVAHINFTLLKVAVPRPVVAQIYSLEGNPIRRLEQQFAGGAQVMTWNGRDEAGEVVAPGLYLCRIGVSADTESGRQKQVHLIAVAY